MSIMKKMLMLAIVMGIILIIVTTGKYISGDISADKVFSIEVSKYKYVDSQEKIIRSWKFDEKQSIDKLIKCLNKKERTYDDIEMRPMEYKVILHYNNGESDEYSLWLDKKDNGQGTLILGNKRWYVNSNLLLKGILK